MIVFAVILFAAAALMIYLGARIARGRIELIHDYHRTHVLERDRIPYGRAFSRGLYVIGACFAADGIFELAVPYRYVWYKILLMFAGIVAGCVFFVRAQNRYNGGMF